MTRLLLPLAWATSFLPSYSCTSSGASIAAFGLGYIIFAIVWLYVVWREYCCLWPGLTHLCYCMAVRCMARVLLPSSWVNSSLLSYGCTPYGASIHAFSLGYLIFAIVWLYAVWREYYCLWPGLPHLCHRMAARHMVRVLLPVA